MRTASAILALALAAATAIPNAAQAPSYAEPAWLSLERGKRSFEAKRFGEALIAFDQAIEARRVTFSWAAERLAKAIEAPEAKKAKGSISRAMAAFAEVDFIRGEYEALVAKSGGSAQALLASLKAQRISDNFSNFIDAQRAVLEYRPAESLRDSIPALSLAITQLSRYPEAEYWKGRVFEVEGELVLAEMQFERALAQRDSLDVADVGVSILYAMARLYETRADWVAWENVMRRISSGDVGFKGDAKGPQPVDRALGDAMSAALKEMGFDRFMTLYRLEPTYALDAYESLASFCIENGRPDALLNAAIAVNMTLTRAIAIAKLKEREFSWKGLDDLYARAAKSEELERFLRENPVERLLVILADALYAEGARRSATSIWDAVAKLDAEPFSAVAKARLRNPSSAVRRP